MRFLGRFFGRSAPAPIPESPADTPPAPALVPSPARLAYNPHLTDFDGQLARLLREQAAMHLEHQRALHIDIFRGRIPEPVEGLTLAELLGVELQSLVDSLVQWGDRTLAAMHEMVSKSRSDWEGDVLAVFFDTSVNASNYDGLILEEVIRIATATFDDALALATAAYPSLVTDEITSMRVRWMLPLLNLEHRWQEMHQDRFNAIYRSWESHQHADALASAFAAMCQAHFQVEAQHAVRLYRETLLPVVTTDFAEHDLDVSNVMDADTLAELRKAAFESFPVSDAQERAPVLARAYMLAWFDVFRIATDTKESASAKGRERYASEITAMDCDEQFGRLGEKEVDKWFMPLFEEVKAYYAGRMAA